jgi:pheromone shutdown protein TraB
MENNNEKTLYEIRMEEIEKLKNVVEKTISLSRSVAFKGNLIEKKKKSDELKKLIDDIRKNRPRYWWESL